MSEEEEKIELECTSARQTIRDRRPGTHAEGGRGGGYPIVDPPSGLRKDDNQARLTTNHPQLKPTRKSRWISQTPHARLLIYKNKGRVSLV